MTMPIAAPVHTYVSEYLNLRRHARSGAQTSITGRI